MQKLNILFVTGQLFPDNIGGVGIHCYELCKELSGFHNISILACRNRLPEDRGKRGSYIFDENLEGLKVRWIAANSIHKKKEEVLRSQFVKRIQEFSPHLIHFMHLIGFPPQLPELASDLGVPYIITIHDFWYICERIKLIKKNGAICSGPGMRCGICLTKNKLNMVGHLFRAVKSRLRYGKFREILGGAKALFFCSHDLRSKYLSNIEDPDFKKKCVVLKYGIDNARFSRQREYAGKKGGVTFGYLGAIIPEKGVHILLQAFKEMPESCELHIYGHGKKRYIASLKEQIRDFASRVRFLGPYSYHETPEVLRNIDILVVPSLWPEAYGIVAQEARVAGIPVIASNTGGLGEQIYDGVNGFLFRPGNVQELRQKMMFLLEDRKAKAINLTLDFNARDISQCAQDYAACYKAILTDPQIKSHPRILEFTEEILEISEFTGKPASEIVDTLCREITEPGITVRKAWLRERPSGEEEVRKFCRTTEAYLFHHVAVHKTRERMILTKVAIETFKKHGITSVLHYGGGTGESCLLFHHAGFRGSYYDVSSVTEAFARFRFDRNKIEIDIITKKENLKPHHGIYCLNIVEHRPQPAKIMKDLARFLLPGGMLLLPASFGFVWNGDPSHSPGNTDRALDLIERFHVPGNTLLLFRKNRSQRT
jgi:glycosyltransferase involved in cell wall biosynthesis